MRRITERPRRDRVRLAPLAILLLACLASRSVAADPASPKRAPDAEAIDLLKLGERIYLDGRRASGEPVTARINGDIPIEGTQFTCVSCHQRSGLGSIEGWQVATPVTRAALYAANERRPAYTDESLAVAVRDGTDVTGRAFGSAMPAYDLDDLEMQGLTAYLSSLSTEISPGVTDETIHFATVYTEDAEAEEMLTLLQTFFADKNAEARFQSRRRSNGPWYRDNRNLPYRKWALHPWVLTGDPASWERQLESYYADRPVFALVSGMSTGEWWPVHEFCERNRIPAILPNVDRPVIDDKAFYTLYFSRGQYAEADVLVEEFARGEARGGVLQVYRRSTSGAGVADALRASLDAGGPATLEELELRRRRTLTPAMLDGALREAGVGTAVLWLGATAFSPAEDWEGFATDATIYLSSTLLGRHLSGVPEGLRRSAKLIHPFTLPAEAERRFRRVAVWMEKHGLEVRDRRVLAQTWFACLMLHEGLMHIRYENFYREFFLESIDHTTAKITPYSAQYPTPSFGPGQRYLSKGCYVVDLAGGEIGAGEARWVVPRPVSGGNGG